MYCEIGMNSLVQPGRSVHTTHLCMHTYVDICLCVVASLSEIETDHEVCANRKCKYVYKGEKWVRKCICLCVVAN